MPRIPLRRLDKLSHADCSFTFRVLFEWPYFAMRQVCERLVCVRRGDLSRFVSGDLAARRCYTKG